MPPRPSILSFIAIAVLTISNALAAAAEPPTTDITTRLDRAIQHTTSGAYWGVALIAKPYGFADYAATPNTLDTLFEIASVSKPFTAVGIYRLQMDGNLDINDPIGKHLPAVTGPHAEVTIHQLLTHTSGLSPQLGLPYASTATRAEFIEHIQSKPLATEPGTAYAYSNPGYALLAAIIEEISTQPFEQFIRENIFLPAGMSSTGFITDPHLVDRPTASRRSQRDADSTATAADWHWSWGYRGMGGVVTTAADLHAWSRALDAGEILDEASLDAMFTPNLSSYASGWVVTNNSAGIPVQMHTGGVEGFAAILARIPSDDTLIVLLSNDGGNLYGVYEQVSRVLYPVPTISATIDAGDRPLDENRSIRSPDWSWSVTPDAPNAQIILALEDTDAGETIAELTLTAQSARKLANDLRDALAARTAAPHSLPDEHAVYFARYEPRTRVELTDLQLRLQPGYTTMDEDGNPMTDPRIVVVVDDEANFFWPIMTRLSDASARALADQLEKSLIE